MSLQSFVAQLPRQVHLPDDTLTLALEGYAFIGNRCRLLDTDVFETRLMLQRTICMLGAEAARIFYSDRMQRTGAAPLRLQATLFGRGGVQSLDDAPHHERKRLFAAVLAPDQIAQLCRLVYAGFAQARATWGERIVVLEEAQRILCRAACAWTGIVVDDDRRLDDIAAMIDGAGGVGPRHWRGRVGRARAEWWIERQIELARSGVRPATSMLATFAASSLDARTAAVELLNVIRPTVAIARYVAFAVLALHDYPHTSELVEQDEMLEPFVQEVRRFYPFFPAAVARVHTPFSWHGLDFTEGTRVMLDLYGTNHDRRTWRDPDQFRPERFVGWAGDPFTLIPQGGGDVMTGHRCPGEKATIEVLKTVVRFLRGLHYDVPAQDLEVSLARIPAIPGSGMVIANIR